MFKASCVTDFTNYSYFHHQMELQGSRLNISAVSSDSTKLLRLMLKANQANTVEHGKLMNIYYYLHK